MSFQLSIPKELESTWRPVIEHQFNLLLAPLRVSLQNPRVSFSRHVDYQQYVDGLRPGPFEEFLTRGLPQDHEPRTEIRNGVVGGTAPRIPRIVLQRRVDRKVGPAPLAVGRIDGWPCRPPGSSRCPLEHRAESTLFTALLQQSHQLSPYLTRVIVERRVP